MSPRHKFVPLCPKALMAVLPTRSDNHINPTNKLYREAIVSITLQRTVYIFSIEV